MSGNSHGLLPEKATRLPSPNTVAARASAAPDEDADALPRLPAKHRRQHDTHRGCHHQEHLRRRRVAGGEHRQAAQRHRDGVEHRQGKAGDGKQRERAVCFRTLRTGQAEDRSAADRGRVADDRGMLRSVSHRRQPPRCGSGRIADLIADC